MQHGVLLGQSTDGTDNEKQTSHGQQGDTAHLQLSIGIVTIKQRTITMAQIELSNEELKYLFHILPPAWEKETPKEVHFLRSKIFKAIED